MPKSVIHRPTSCPGRGLTRMLAGLRIPMDDRRIHAMGEADDLRQTLNDQRGLRPRKMAAPTALKQSGQVAAVDVLVGQAGRVGAEVSVKQRHDALVFALLHDLVDDPRLVLEQTFLRGGVEAELQRHRGDAVEVRVPRLPHLPETAGAEQLFQLPVHAGQRPVATLEPRQAGGKERQEVFRLAKGRSRSRGPAGRVAWPPQTAADRSRHLAEVSGHLRLLLRRQGGRLLPDDLRNLLPEFARGELRDGLHLHGRSSSFVASFQASHASTRMSPPTPKVRRLTTFFTAALPMHRRRTYATRMAGFSRRRRKRRGSRRACLVILSPYPEIYEKTGGATPRPVVSGLSGCRRKVFKQMRPRPTSHCE